MRMPSFIKGRSVSPKTPCPPTSPDCSITSVTPSTTTPDISLKSLSSSSSGTTSLELMLHDLRDRDIRAAEVRNQIELANTKIAMVQTQIALANTKLAYLGLVLRRLEPHIVKHFEDHESDEELLSGALDSLADDLGTCEDELYEIHLYDVEDAAAPL